MARAVRWWWKSNPATDLLRAAMLAAGLASAAAAQAPLQDFSPFNTAPLHAGQPQTGLRVVALTLHPAGKKPLHYRVEVAATARQQAIGMMFRRSVPAGTGMLFPMDAPREASFWMRNTLIPLDIIFIGTNRRILNISENTPPLSDDPVSSAGPAIAVLELAGGEAQRIGLKAGDEIRWTLR